MDKKTPSLQDIIRKRQHSEFVGRTEQLELFRHNLDLSWDDPQRLFIFNVWGQGGVGKSTLLRRFREQAHAKGVVVAWTDEAETDLPSVLGRWSADFRQQGHALKAFDERYKIFRQKQEELEADPQAPQGFTAFATRAVTKVATRAVKTYVPGSEIVLEYVDEDALVGQMSEWAEFVRKRLSNKDEIRLVLEPVETLTPIFLELI